MDPAYENIIIVIAWYILFGKFIRKIFLVVCVWSYLVCRLLYVMPLRLLVFFFSISIISELSTFWHSYYFLCLVRYLLLDIGCIYVVFCWAYHNGKTVLSLNSVSDHHIILNNLCPKTYYLRYTKIELKPWIRTLLL